MNSYHSQTRRCHAGFSLRLRTMEYSAIGNLIFKGAMQRDFRKRCVGRAHYPGMRHNQNVGTRPTYPRNRNQKALMELSKGFTTRGSYPHEVGHPICKCFRLLDPDLLPAPIFPGAEVYFPPDRVENRPDIEPPANLFGKQAAPFQVA